MVTAFASARTIQSVMGRKIESYVFVGYRSCSSNSAVAAAICRAGACFLTRQPPLVEGTRAYPCATTRRRVSTAGGDFRIHKYDSTTRSQTRLPVHQTFQPEGKPSRDGMEVRQLHYFSSTSHCGGREGGNSSPTKTPQGKQEEGLVLWSHDAETKILTITLNSASTYNALTVEMGKQFSSVIRDLSTNIHRGTLQANACILTGSGKAFSSGGDLSWLRSRRDVPVHINADDMRDFYGSFLCVRQLPIPTIASIHGPAMGAGACLSLACDMRVTCGDAKIGFNFVTLGIHAGMGASHFLPKTIGRTAAHEALLTGKVFRGVEAKEVGLITTLVDTPDQVPDAARALAMDVASRQHPLAVRSMLRSLRMEEEEGLDAALRREADAQALCYAREDWGEGLSATVERRSPYFGEYHDS